MSDTVCTIQKKFTAVNTFFLLGFSNYVSFFAIWSLKKKNKQKKQKKKKIADTIGGKKKIQLISLIYSWFQQENLFLI